VTIADALYTSRDVEPPGLLLFRHVARGLAARKPRTAILAGTPAVAKAACERSGPNS
jgi:hypothetical protein